MSVTNKNNDDRHKLIVLPIYNCCAVAHSDLRHSRSYIWCQVITSFVGSCVPELTCLFVCLYVVSQTLLLTQFYKFDSINLTTKTIVIEEAIISKMLFQRIWIGATMTIVTQLLPICKITIYLREQANKKQAMTQSSVNIWNDMEIKWRRYQTNPIWAKQAKCKQALQNWLFERNRLHTNNLRAHLIVISKRARLSLETIVFIWKILCINILWFVNKWINKQTKTKLNKTEPNHGLAFTVEFAFEFAFVMTIDVHAHKHTYKIEKLLFLCVCTFCSSLAPLGTRHKIWFHKRANPAN